MRRLIPILLLAALLVGLSVGWDGQAPSPVSVAMAGEAAVPIPDEITMAANRVAARAAAPAANTPVVASLPGVPVELAADVSAQLAEEMVLRRLGQAANLQLAPEQWSAFAALTLHHQAIRQAYEATIAKSVVLEHGRYRIEVPAYPTAGDALRARLYSELREHLGAYAAEEIATRLSGKLEGHFGGFGVGIQALDFKADAGRGDADYVVTRTMLYWNSSDAKERLTTRRETHFPGLEDPSGHTWGPFLSLLASSGAPKVGS